MGKLDGKVALISGGSRGQGEAQARLFAREGASVVLADVLDAEGELVAASINDTPAATASITTSTSPSRANGRPRLTPPSSSTDASISWSTMRVLRA